MKFTWEKCPHCHKTINFKSEGGAGTVESPIGAPGFFTCRHCGGRISSGKQEWDDLDFVDKTTHILRMMWTTLFWGAAFGIGFAIGADFLFDGDPLTFGLIGSIGIPILITRGVLVEINESKDRSASLHKD